jgi:hypothetical protein
MPIVETIESALLPHNLIPLWRGGKLVPEMLRSYETGPVTTREGDDVEMVCNYGVLPDGGIVNGEIIPNTVYDRNELASIIHTQPEEVVVPENVVEIQDTPVGRFEYYTEKTIDDNFEF